MILKKTCKSKEFHCQHTCIWLFFSFGRTFDRTFKARRRYFIFGVYTLFLKVQVILNLRYIFEKEKKDMKNKHTIALVIIKNDDILGIYFYRVIYIRYSNYNRPWYFMYIQCGKWFLIRYLSSTKSLISVLNDILIILKNNIVHIVIS